jgi:acyl carrier protein
MQDELRSYLEAHHTGNGRATIRDDESLLEAGLLDSVAMVDLVAHLEQTYGIRVDEDDMTPENFDSISAIAAYLAGKQAAS